MTDKERPKTDEQVIIPKDGKVDYGLDPGLAVVLYPALGNPAIVQKKMVGEKYSSRLSLIIISPSEAITEEQVAQHLKISTWADKDLSTVINDIRVRLLYQKNLTTVKKLKCCPADTDHLGLGPEGKDDQDEDADIKLSQLNVFPWVLKGLNKYKHLYKITINLEDIGPGMYNILWVNKDDYIEMRERPKWWNLLRHIKDFVNGETGFPRIFKKELKEYGGDVKDMSNDPKNKELDENIRATIYHPFFVTTKKDFSIGHVTDIHLDTRMDVYGQSEASVIEVKENCPPVAEGNRRKIINGDFHVSIKNRIANFNQIFMDICSRLVSEGANILVITGDLVDYNRGLHSPQTHRTCFTPIAETWEALSSSVSKDDYYKDDRNWFLFYKKMLELYDKHAVPIFTMLGNHDYVNYGMAPWPDLVITVPWNGVFDQNLTLYESALCFGEGYNSSRAFRKDVIEKTDYVEWYTLFINPFMDYVVNCGNLSMLMVDWGVKSNIATSFFSGSGSLHHARHLFKKKSDYDKAADDGMGGNVIVTNHEPFPVRNYSIYESFVKQKDKVKILFMHATGICPTDDVSIGQVNHDLDWTDSKLRYGSFDHRRSDILNDVEKGDLHMLVAGHSHRNVVMEVDQRHEKRPVVLGDGETYGIVKHQAKNLVMVTSSGGPLPKYLPGGPKICGCSEKYNHGWDYDKKTLYEYTYGDEKEALTHLDEKDHLCIECGMMARDMAAKKPKRHRPGGSLLKFDFPTDPNSGPMVAIESIPSEIAGSFPRRGVQGDEHEVFTQSMKMEHIDSYREFKKWKDEKPISIISRQSFTYYGYMEFPHKVRYVTFSKGAMGGQQPVTRANVDGKQVIRQYIEKDFFDDFMISAQEKLDFAFARYGFDNTFKDAWDREIRMYKEMETLSGSEAEAFRPGNDDPYKGLVMFFPRKPDLKKRKEVCGY